MTQYNYNNAPVEGGELLDGVTLSAEAVGDYDRSYILLPEGDYPFNVVNVETTRYNPGPNSKIGPCKQVIVTLRVTSDDFQEVDLKHNLYCWNSKSCIGMIAQFFDSIGMHKKGEPLNLDWRREVLIGKNGVLKLNHRVHRDDTDKPADQQRKYNNIQTLYKKDEEPASHTQAKYW